MKFRTFLYKLLVTFPVSNLGIMKSFKLLFKSSLIFNILINPYHAELYTQDITCMLNCFEEISQNLAFFLFLLCS